MENVNLLYLESLWSTPEFEYESGLDFGEENTDGVRGLFFTSPVTYNGKPTKVAAYIGFPQGASEEKKVPAIVLVHGGVATAIPQWVKYWNDLGFAAISLDTEGGEPIKGICNEDTSFHLERNRYCGSENFEAGPTNNGFADWEEKLENQWIYHATSATIVATSLISSFDCVDPQRIGMTGVSWGSVITSIVVGHDERISFAMPVYGGLSLMESHAQFANIHPNLISAKRWDTLEGLKNTNCKLFYVTSDADWAFSMDIASRSAFAAKGFVNFKHGFVHGQAQGAYEENLPNFARHVCGMDAKYIEVIQHPTRQNPTMKVQPYGGAKVAYVRVCYTHATKTGQDAVWHTIDVSLKNDTEYVLDMPESNHAYVQVCYDDGLTVCSYLF